MPDEPFYDEDDDFEFGPLDPESPEGGLTTDSDRISPVKAYGVVMLIYVVATAVSVMLYFGADRNGPWNWGTFFFFSILAHAIAGLRVVKETEFGAIFFFGIPIKECFGPVWAPPGIIRLETAPRSVIQVEFPDEPENVQKSDQDNVQEGKKATIRITHASPDTALFDDPKGVGEPLSCHWRDLEKEDRDVVLSDPLNRRLTSEVSGYIRFRIRQGEFIQFIQVTGSYKEALRSLEDTWVSVAQDWLGKLTPAGAISHKRFVSQKIKEAVEILIGERASPDGTPRRSWGIDLEGTQIKLIDIGEQVNKSMAAASSAEFGRHATVSAAEGERQKRILEGEGEGSRLASVGEGEAKALSAVNAIRVRTAKEMAEIAGSIGGQFALGQETIQKGLEHSKHTIIVPSTSSLLGAVAGIQSLVTGGEESPKK